MKIILALLVCCLLAPAPVQAFGFSVGGFGSGPMGGNNKDMKRARHIRQGYQLAGALIPISDQQEVNLGRGVVKQILTRYPLDKAPEQTYYLNVLGTALAQRSDRPLLQYHFAILATDDVNAYAAPGGFIFVTRGALDMVADEAELAAVLAHEISHITERHIVKALQQSRLMSVGKEAVADALKVPDQLFDKMTKFATNALFKGLKKKDEYGADAKAIQYLDRLGYDQTAMFDVLKLLSERRKHGQAKVLAKTHPRPADRIRKLKAASEKLDLDIPTGIRLSERFHHFFSL